MNDLGNSAAMGAMAGIMMTVMMVFFVLALFMIICLWKIFTKAGKPGWAAIVPIYNYIIMLEIVGKPIWWIVLMLIPLVNFVIAIILLIEIAKSFGKSTGFAIGMLFFPFIFYPILAFGDSVYLGPGGVGAVPEPVPSY